ncbi:MAG TPA: hypothetical protein VLG28_06920 [Acidimicrobiia bacterium]|jgi:hypothetical protein|nr:hypothetical protein [Acidimicrobiia bacterium]
MADITKRSGKKLRERLAGGETVEHAILVETKGTYGLGLFALATAPRTTQRHLEQRAAESREGSTGMSAGFPTGSAVIAATNRRILVVPSNGLTFGDTALDAELGQLRVGEVAGKLLGRRMQIVFSDGSGVEVDVQRGQSIDKLADRIGRVA